MTARFVDSGCSTELRNTNVLYSNCPCHCSQWHGDVLCNDFYMRPSGNTGRHTKSQAQGKWVFARRYPPLKNGSTRTDCECLRREFPNVFAQYAPAPAPYLPYGTSKRNRTKIIKNTTAHRVKEPKHPPSTDQPSLEVRDATVYVGQTGDCHGLLSKSWRQAITMTHGLLIAC